MSHKESGQKVMLQADIKTHFHKYICLLWCQRVKVGRETIIGLVVFDVFY